MKSLNTISFSYAKCPEPSCTNGYLGETCRRIIEQTAGHTGKDKQSHLLKHALTRNIAMLT